MDTAMANYCSNCGTKLNPGAKFCPNCGQLLSSGTGAAAESPLPSPAEPFPSRMKAPGKESSASAARKRTAAQAPPRRSAPVRAAEPAPVSEKPKKKKKKKFRILGWLLAAVILIEFYIAAYKNPGFLVKDPDVADLTETIGELIGSFTGTTGGEPGPGQTVPGPVLSYEGDNGEIIPISFDEEPWEELTPDNAPGSTALIDVVIPEEEKASVPRETAGVSPEEPVCRFGDITVDFGRWNLLEDDQVLMQSFGEKPVRTDGSHLVAYDFQMASGQHEFATDVTLIIPRTAGDRDGRVVYYDEANGSWEPLAYQISEDARYYTVYTDHFTTIAEWVKIAETARKTDSDALGMLYAVPQTESGTPYSILHQPLDFNYSYLTDIYFGDESTVDQIITNGGISAKASINKAINSIIGWEGYGDAGYGAYGLVFQTSQTTSGVMWIIGTSILIAKIIYQASNNKTIWPVIRDNLFGIAGSVASAGALAAGAFLGSVASVPFALCALACFAIPMYFEYEENVKIESKEEEAYRYYLNHYRCDLSGNRIILSMDGKGWGYEFKYIANKNLTTPQNINKEVDALIDEYLMSFWETEDAGDRGLYLHQANPEKYGSHMWEEPDDDARGRYIARAKSILYNNIKDEFYELCNTYLHRMEEALQKEFDYIKPYLNQWITFYAVDPSLDKDQKFDDSQYSYKMKGWLMHYGYEQGVPIFDERHLYSYMPSALRLYDPEDRYVYFKDQQPVMFWPINESVDEYSAAAFVPHANKKSNIIFSCRMYNYMQMGCPRTLTFTGNGLSDYPEQEEVFTIPASRRPNVDVVVTIGETPAYDGDWWEEGEKIGRTVVRFALEGNEIYLRVNSASSVSPPIRTKEFTTTGNSITIRSEEFPGGTCEIRFLDKTHISLTIDGQTRTYVHEDTEAEKLKPFLGTWNGQFNGNPCIDIFAYREGHVIHGEVSSEGGFSGGVMAERYTYDEASKTLTIYGDSFRGGSVTCVLEGDDTLVTTNGEGLQTIFQRDEQVNYVQIEVREDKPENGPSALPSGTSTMGPVIPTDGGISLGGD